MSNQLVTQTQAAPKAETKTYLTPNPTHSAEGVVLDSATTGLSKLLNTDPSLHSAMANPKAKAISLPANHWDRTVEQAT